MITRIEDLSPLFEDRCWMFVLLARQANVAVILRRGPIRWWHVTLWDKRHDIFEGGQWFRGRMYPERCDLSPDGKLFIYFAGKYRLGDVARGYDFTWIAVSRPPYLTALALWPVGDAWGGQSVFIDDRTVLVAKISKHHPDHPPGPLRVFEYGSLKKEDPLRNAVPCWQRRWVGIPASVQPSRRYVLYTAWRKSSDGMTMQRNATAKTVQGIAYDPYPSRHRSLYTLYRPDGKPVAQFQAHWADWDQRGRLVATVGGRMLEGKLKGGKLLWRQIAAMHDEKPAPMVAPDWAQHW
jgi:hypothetical protein